jgi:DNA adenine methylase
MQTAERTIEAKTAARRSVRPFLKWAGGKRQLLAELRRFVPSEFNSYHEPFLGSGALFFDLWGRGVLAGHRAYLTDSNTDLIGCCTAVRDDVETVIACLEGLERRHRENPEAHYYKVRDRLFNPRRENQVSSGSYSPELAAMFIYLNRTGFNGLFRLNARGAFNVPVGRYFNPTICDRWNLRRVATALSSSHVHLGTAGYQAVLETARAGDLVYFDPPYAPLSATARFTAYTAAGFTNSDQLRLRDIAGALIDRGCQVIISNSTAPVVRELYGAVPGLRAHKVAAKRAINSDSRKRGMVMEYIISNVEPTTPKSV